MARQTDQINIIINQGSSKPHKTNAIMKSEKKMDEIIIMLNSIKRTEDLSTAKELANSITTLLQEFLVDNCGSSKKKFDMYNYTKKNDPIRPHLAGVCHDTVNKCAVATDAHLLVIDRGTYDETVETRFADQLDSRGRICIDKYGKKIDGIFPENYMGVLPSKEKFNESEHLQISPDELNEYIKRAKSYMKAHDIHGREIRYRIGETFFDAKLLLSFLIASDGNIAVTKQDKHFSSRGIWYTDERQCLLMPILMDEFDLGIEGKVIGQEEGLYLVDYYTHY